MADNTSTFVLRVKTEGMPEAKKDSQIIRDNLEGAQKAASGTATSRRVASSAAARPTGAAGASAGITGGDVAEYNRAAGAAGKAGGSARDFADQARGLGGLVRLYATFAANIFAVTAAFGALSRAMDTTNMIKGLDQLGAAAGKSLSTLSKDLVSVTDGAISMREAMEATAKASAAGLSNAQILGIGEAAKKASQALGINMPDAFSRLSRGISKLEPELLDEIGIYVKIDDATQNYARTIGKTASTLSDFEKRQAFANAVLDQAKQKFAGIEVDVNPYTKLLATLQNVLQTGLEFINKFLAPVAKYLSESPVALAGVLTLIGGILLKQVIPVLGQWGTGFRKASEEAAQSAEKIKNSFSEDWVSKIENRFKVPNLKKSLEDVDKQINKLSSKRLPDAGVIPKGLSSLATISNLAEDVKSVKGLQELIDKRKQYVDTGIAGNKKLSDSQINTYKTELDWLNKTQQGIETRLKLKDLEAQKTKLQTELTAANEKVQTQADKRLGRLDPETLSMKNYENIIKKRDQYSAIAAAAENARVVGIKNAWALLNKEIAEKGITGISKYTTLALGGLTAVGSRVMQVADAFGMAAAVLGIAVGAFSIFDSWASKATKQQEELNSKLEENANAIKTSADTFDLYTRKRKDAFSIDGIVAFTNALSGVADSFDQAVFAFKKFKEAAGVWDNLKDSIGKSNLDKVQQEAFKSIESIGKSLITSAEGSEKFTEELSKIGISKENLKNINEFDKVFKGLTETERLKKLEQINYIFKLIEEQEKRTTGATKAFIESLQAIDKIVDQIIQANAFQDLQGKLGVELVDAAEKLAQALDDPRKALEALSKLAQDPKAFSSLTNVNLRELYQAVQYQTELRDIQKELEADRSKKKTLESEKSTLEVSDVMRQAGTSMYGETALAKALFLSNTEAESAIERNRKETNKVDEKIIANEKRLKELQKEAQKWAISQANIIDNLAAAGFEKIQIGLKKAEELARISVRREQLSMAAAVGADTAKQQYDLSLEEIRIQKTLIEASYNQEIAVRKNTEELAKLNAIQSIIAGATLKNKEGATVEEKRAGEMSQETGTKALLRILAKEDLRGGKKAEDVTAQYGELAVRGAQTEIRGDTLPELKKRAALASENAKATIAGLKYQNDLTDQKLRKEQASLAVQKDRLTIEGEFINIATQLNSYSSDSLISLREKNQLDLLANDIASKRKILEAEALKVDERKDTYIAGEYERLVAIGEQKFKNLLQEEQAKKLAIEFNTIREKTNAKIAAITAQEAVNNENLRSKNSVQEAIISNKQRELDLLSQLGRLDEVSLNRRKIELDIQLQQLRFTEQEANLKANLVTKEAALAGAKEATKKAEQMIGQGPATAAQSTALEQAKTAQSLAQSQVDAARTALDAGQRVNQIVQEGITLQGHYNEQLIKQKQHLEDIANVSGSLAAVFGRTGKAIGDTLGAIDSLSTKQDNYNKQLMYNNAIINDKEASQEAVQKATEENALITKKFQKDELAGSIQIIGSVKGLFKEKTAAYKAFAAVEKALHIARIAMEFKELATSLFVDKTKVASGITAEGTQTATTTAGFLARAGTYVTEIFSKVSSQLGVFGPPIAAAIVAAIGLGAFGKGSKAPPGGFTAEEQNKVQGTGQTYRDGKLVTREGGVLGDPTARAESVSKSLEFVGKNTFEFLESGNKMIDALKAIERNTRGLTQAMLRSLSPERATSLPGSIKTGELRGNYFGSTGMGAATGIGLGLGANAFIGIGGAIAGGGALGGLAAGLAGSLGGMLLPGIGLLLAKPIGKLLGSIFGGKTTQTIEAFGITVNGVLDDVVQGTKGVIEEWANVKTVRKGGWFRSDKTTYDTMRQEAEDPVKKLIGSLFLGVKDTLSEASKALGVDISTELSNYLIKDFKIQAKDLKPEELAQAIQGEVSIAFNKMAMDLLPQFEQFAQPFEEAGQTIVRLARQVQVFDLAMTSISKSTENLSSMMRVEISNSLIEMAGGLDQFVEQTKFYSENFLTEAERLVPVQKAVTTQLDKLGLSFVDTREEFKAVVDAIDFSLPAQRELYNTLMKLAPAFAEVYKAADKTEKALSAEEFRAKAMEQGAQILKLLGKEEDALNLSRAKQIEELKKLPPAQADVLIAQQLYINALEDEKTAKEKLANFQEQFTSKLIADQLEIFNILSNTAGAIGENAKAEVKRITALQKLGDIKKLPEAMQDALIANQKYKDALNDVRVATEANNAVQTDLTSKFSAQRATMLKLISGEENLTTARDAEIAQFASYSGTQKDLLIANQKYIYALEDEKTAKEKLAELQQKLAEEQEQIRGRLTDQQVTMLNLLGRSEEAILATRAKELMELSKLPAAQAQTLIANQKYIYALEDEQRAKEELTKQQDELVSKTYDQQLTILNLLGKSEEALKLTRSKELAELAKYPEAQAKILIANQKYIYALEDEQKAKEAVIKQQEKLKSTLSTLKGVLDNLNNYRQSLLGGGLSTLTPQEQYTRLQGEFATLQKTAFGPATTAAELAAQQEAIGKLPDLGDKVLEASRVLFASSDQYTVDFQGVLNTISKAQTLIGEQATDAEKQLKEIETQTGILTDIEESTASTAKVIKDFLAAQSTAIELGVFSRAAFDDVEKSLASTIEDAKNNYSKAQKASLELSKFATLTIGDIESAVATATKATADAVRAATDNYNTAQATSASLASAASATLNSVGTAVTLATKTATDNIAALTAVADSLAGAAVLTDKQINDTVTKASSGLKSVADTATEAVGNLSKSATTTLDSITTAINAVTVIANQVIDKLKGNFASSAGMSPEDKAARYRDLRSAGLTDAQIRSTIESMFGKQSETDWATLIRLAGTVTKAVDASTAAATVVSSSVDDKIAQYKNLAKTVDPSQIRSMVEGIFGKQTDTDWAELVRLSTTATTAAATAATAATSAATTTAQVATTSIEDKIAEYRDLAKTKSAEEIRRIAEAKYGKQTDADWAELVRLATPPVVTTTPPAGVTKDSENVVTAIKELKQEISDLRTEQAAQTGAIITSNAQVVNSNAQTVSTAVADTAEANNWYSRQLVALD